jgi:hypothetical protein
MTGGSPAPGFRRRIVARIEAGDAPRRSWRAAVVLTPLAATAGAIVFAMFVAQSNRHPGAEHAPPLQRESPGTAPLVAAEVVAPVAVVAPRVPRRAVRNAGRTGLAPPETATPLEPITVAPLTVGALSPDPMPIERLGAIVPITVAPLEIPDTQRRHP